MSNLCFKISLLMTMYNVSWYHGSGMTLVLSWCCHAPALLWLTHHHTTHPSVCVNHSFTFSIQIPSDFYDLFVYWMCRFAFETDVYQIIRVNWEMLDSRASKLTFLFIFIILVYEFSNVQDLRKLRKILSILLQKCIISLDEEMKMHLKFIIKVVFCCLLAVSFGAQN